MSTANERINQLRKKYGIKTQSKTDDDTTSSRIAALREKYGLVQKSETAQPPSVPVRETLSGESITGTAPSYAELADMTLQERLARSQLGQQEAAKNMLKDAGYVGERFGLGVATGLEGLADAAILAKAQGLLDSAPQKAGKAIADLLGIRKKTTEELMAEALAQKALSNQATAPWQASIEDRYDPNRVTETVGEISQTIGNMAPSIAGNILLPGIGIPVMGASAGGQGAQQAYQETADLEKATLYGMATGGLEAGTELLFGGLAGLGKGVADTAVGKAVKKAASALGDSKAGKVISGFANSPVVKAVADSLGEGVEEVIATYLDPFLQRVIYNPNAQNATAEELLQSGLMGMLVGGVFQVGNAALGGLMGEGYVPPEQAEPDINEMDAAPVQTEQDINAVDNQPEQTHLSNKQVERMIRDDATMQEMGIDTNGKTMSQLRNEVRARMAAQEQGIETSSEENRVQTPAEETALMANPVVTEETQAEQVVNTRTEGITNGEEVYLRNGSQRAGSANPGGQVSAVEEGTGRVESGQAERQVADRGAAALTYGERVSTNSLGIGGGSIKNNIRLLKSGDTQHTAEAKRIAKERGLRVYFFADDNLSIRQKNGEFASVRGYITGDRVFIRADHPLHTADQIMRHEAGHDMIAKGEVDLGEVRKRVKKAAGGREVRRIAKMYAEAYAGTDMTAEEIWEEVACDSLGDMNIFAGKVSEEEAGAYLSFAKDAVQVEDDGNVIPLSERFNPDKVDIRYSMEPTSEFKPKRKVNAAEFSETTKQAIKDAQLAGMMNQGRKDAEKLRRAKETTAEVRRKRDDTIQNLKEHQREQRQKASESRNASAIRAKIQRHVADLSRTLRNPTDKKHVPEALRGPVAKLLESINLESKDGAPTKRTQAFNELKKVYAEIAENLVIDPDLLGGEGTTGLLDDVIAMADKRIADMNTEELDTIWKAVRAIEASVRSANKMFAAARFQTVSEAADALRSDNLFKRGKTELNYIDKLQKLTGVDMLTPEAYFHRLGKAGDAIFRMMRNAQDKHIRLMKQVADFTNENLSDVDVRALEKEMHTVRLGGQDVELSTAQLMELYALMRRQQAMEHLQGGILPEVVAKRGLKKAARPAPARGVSLDEMMEAVSLLSAEQVQVAELLQEYASTTLSDFGNEASMEVYGYRKFNEEHYWPIRSKDVNRDVPGDTQTVSIAGRGFTKNVKPHADNAVMVGSIFDTFAAHASDMATYSAWLGTSEDVNRIRNFKFRVKDDDGKYRVTGTVEDILEMVHGVKKGEQYLQKLLADIANGVKGVDVSASMTGGLLGNYKAASVGGNLRVVIQQPTAILRAFDMVDPKYFLPAMKPNHGFEKAKKYAPIAQWKDWGYFDIHTGRQMKDVLFNSASALDKTREASMWLAGKMDSVSWGMLWNAIEAETKDKTDLNPGTEAFYQKVAERFNEVIDRTQVVDGILQRSQIMRDPGDLKKMVTSFMGEPTKQYNMLLSAVYDARNGIPGGKRALIRTGVSLATAAVMNAAVQSIIDAFRDDDREQDYWEKWMEAFLGVGSEDNGAMKLLNSNVGSAFNPLGYLPYVKDAWSLIQGYDVSRMDMDSIDKTVSAAGNLIKALRGEGKSTIGGAVITMLAEMGKLAGVPVANLKREITSFALTAAMESDNHLMEYRIRRVLYKVPENTTMYYDILYSAMQNDPEAYEIIYADMVRSGLGEDKIKNGMEKRMKSAQGVESVADLEQRWMSPEQKGAYDTYLRRMERSAVWGKAKADQRSTAEELLYKYVTGSADKMAEKLEDGIRYGVDETEYILYKLALSMADKPSENGNYGSYTNDEVKAAIDMLGLGKKESAWLWEAQGRSEKSNPYK